MGVLYAVRRVSLPSYAPPSTTWRLSSAPSSCLPGWASPVWSSAFWWGRPARCSCSSPGLRGLRLRPTLDLAHPGVRRILRLYAPVAASLLVSAGVVTLDTRLASQTGQGSLAAMGFATNLVQFPLGLVATALSFAVLPVLARYGPEGARTAGFQRTLGMGMKAGLLLIVPATVALIMLRTPVVRLLFQRGAFGSEGKSI